MADASPRRQPPTTPDVQHEESDVNIRAIFGFGAALVVVAVVVHVAGVAAVRLFRRAARARAGRGRSIRWRPTQAEPAAAGAAAADQSARRTCATLRAREDADPRHRTAGSTRTPASSASRSSEAMKLTLERGLPARQAAQDEPNDVTTEDAEDTEDSDACFAVSVPSCPLWPSCPRAVRRSAHGPDDAAPAPPATSASPACRRRRVPAPLREIGFDQNLDRARAARHAVSSTRPGATVRLGDYFGTRPVVLRVRVLRVPDALHAGAQRRSSSALGVLSLDAGQGLRDRHGQLRPARDAGAGARRRRRRTCERYKRPGAADGWHFLTGDAAVDRAADAGRRLPLRLGRADASSSRTRPASSSLTPDGRLGALPLRHRVRPARPAAGAGRGVGGQGRLAGRRAAALLLPLRPDDRPLRPRRSCARCASPASRTVARARRVHPDHAARASARPHGPTWPALERPSAYEDSCGPAPRSSPNSASTIAGRVDALYFFLIAVTAFFSLLIAGLIVYFAVKYRRRHRRQRSARAIHGGAGARDRLDRHPVPDHDGDLRLGRQRLLRDGRARPPRR